MSVKAYKATDPNLPKFPASYNVTAVQDLNCTDIQGNNNKYYHLEVQVAADGAARVHSEYGRVGARSPAREYRYAASEAEARAIFDGIVHEKTTRRTEPYVKVELAKRDIGSSEAQAIIRPMNLDDDTLRKANIEVKRSDLHPEVQRVVGRFFGATGRFVEMNLKCPLGQLTREQIDQGRTVLDEAKSAVNSIKKVMSKKMRERLDDLTSSFYSLIPHNFGFKRLDPDALRFSDLTRIAQKEADLDVFLDAKNVAKVLSAESAVDEQYKTLKADLEYIPADDPVFAWLDSLLHRTRASNHGNLGRLSLRSAFRLRREGEGHFDRPTPFLTNAETIAREGSRYMAPHVKAAEDRPDLDRTLARLYDAANVWPVWHGTRNANMTGIISRGLLIRPAGAVHAGSMFGDGLYFAHQSTKSLNYTSVRGSHWASGHDDVGYLLLADVAFGKMHVAPHSHFFQGPPKGCHSVYGKAGTTAGLINDEMIVYHPTGERQQHALRYVLEIHTEPGQRP